MRVPGIPWWLGAAALVGGVVTGERYADVSEAAARRQAPRTITAPRRSNVSSPALERAVHALVNEHRRARGLAVLAPDERISQQARLHSRAMAAGTTPFGHEGFGDRGRTLTRMMACRGTAENVASNHGYRDPASEAVRGWLASRAHRQNIEGRYDRTGVGVAVSATGEIYFTQIFVGP